MTAEEKTLSPRSIEAEVHYNLRDPSNRLCKGVLKQEICSPQSPGLNIIDSFLGYTKKQMTV